MRKIINNTSDINKVIDLIHDQWFDINEIEYTNQTLSIKFKKERYDKAEVLGNFFLWKKIKYPVEEWYLKIFKVKKYEIVDTENIGVYDFKSIEYFKNENKITINTCIPLKFEIDISDLEIAVEETDNVVDVIIRTKFL